MPKDIFIDEEENSYIASIPNYNVDELLEYPFNVAYKSEAAIDFKTVELLSDHKYVNDNLGLEVHTGADCSCFADGLDGLSLSSYGDWGTFFNTFASSRVKKVFLDMIAKKVIVPWRIRWYMPNGYAIQSKGYTYSDGKWESYDGESWKPAEDSFANSYLIAYTDDKGADFSGEPWIHPTWPMNEDDIKREFKFINDVAKAAYAVIFKVNRENVPERVTWDFVNNNKVEL